MKDWGTLVLGVLIKAVIVVFVLVVVMMVLPDDDPEPEPAPVVAPEPTGRTNWVYYVFFRHDAGTAAMPIRMADPLDKWGEIVAIKKQIESKFPVTNVVVIPPWMLLED